MKATLRIVTVLLQNCQIYFNRVFNVVLFDFTAIRHSFIDPTPVPEKLNDGI